MGLPQTRPTADYHTTDNDHDDDDDNNHTTTDNDRTTTTDNDNDRTTTTDDDPTDVTGEVGSSDKDTASGGAVVLDRSEPDRRRVQSVVHLDW